MSGLYKAGGGEKEKLKLPNVIICSLICSAILIFSSVLQTSQIKIFGGVPALTLAFVCAIGFIFGGKAGAVAGLSSGILLDILGNVGFSFIPPIYTVCGYLCGAFVGWLLSKNLPSFLLYAACVGAAREIFTIIHYGLFSGGFNLWSILTKTVIPEFFAYYICVLPAYGIIYVIYTLFKGKDKKEERVK